VSAAPERLKVHRRTVLLEGRPYTALTPRPSGPCKFATNRHHETWHVLTDEPGVHLLGRLFWAMAFQRRERTVVVIDPPVLVPNPFDADPSVPVAIVNLDLGPLSPAAVDELRGQLPFAAPSEGTVVLQTRGLDAALADWREFLRREKRASPAWNRHTNRRWVDGANGMLVIAAPPSVLRGWGASISLPQSSGSSSDAEHLDRPTENGEIHVLEGFLERVAQAQEVRERLYPGRADVELSDEEREQIWKAAPVDGP
jgi:hypothetical protein